ncbi:MAG: hypothetical protein ABI343_00265 [Burkholderiaceae bacterium]
MKELLIAIATATCTTAMAGDLVAHQGNTTVMLADGACTNPMVLKQLDPQVQPLFKSASADLNGQTYSACWVPTPAGVRLVYADGDQGLVPLRALRRLITV